MPTEIRFTNNNGQVRQYIECQMVKRDETEILKRDGSCREAELGLRRKKYSFLKIREAWDFKKCPSIRKSWH
jgi:hypothetical protein